MNAPTAIPVYSCLVAYHMLLDGLLLFDSLSLSTGSGHTILTDMRVAV